MVRKPKGRPAKKARKKSSGPAPDEKKLMDAIGPPDASVRTDADEISGAVDISPPGEADAEAAAQAESEAAPERKADRPKIDGGPPLPDEAQRFLQPGVVVSLVEKINDRLVDRHSMWAASKREARDIGEAVEKVLDKYFPEAGEWSPEALLVSVLLIYAIPRVPVFIASRRAKAIAAGGRSKNAGEKYNPGTGNSPAVSDPRLEVFLDVP